MFCSTTYESVRDPEQDPMRHPHTQSTCAQPRSSFCAAHVARVQVIGIWYVQNVKSLVPAAPLMYTGGNANGGDAPRFIQPSALSACSRTYSREE